nr:hypothetical protein HmN_000770700 [Hymenolepis microstoma]
MFGMSTKRDIDGKLDQIYFSLPLSEHTPRRSRISNIFTNQYAPESFIFLEAEFYGYELTKWDSPVFSMI